MQWMIRTKKKLQKTKAHLEHQEIQVTTEEEEAEALKRNLWVHLEMAAEVEQLEAQAVVVVPQVPEHSEAWEVNQPS